MSGSTISGTVITGITLGTAGYLSPLDITSTGRVTPNMGSYNAGIYVPITLTAGTILNQGTVTGGSDGGTGISFAGTGNLENHGEITGGGSYGGDGVILGGGAELSNFGIIAGGYSMGYGGTGVVTANGLKNYGNIQGGRADGGFAGAGVSGSGTFFNSGHITGGYTENVEPGGGGADLLSNASFLNEGVISGGRGFFGGYGVSLSQNAEITNLGTITGGYAGRVAGVGVIIDGGTLVNAGTVSEGPGGLKRLGVGITAVSFAGTASGTLIVEPGAVFDGKVVASTIVGDLLELSGTSATPLTGIGTQFLNFSNIEFAAGAGWTVEGVSPGIGQTISGFNNQDTLILTGITATSGSYVSGVGLEITNGTFTETLGITGNFAPNAFAVSAINAGTEIFLCYLRGTKILTPQGEAAVEALKIGDPVVTRFGGVQRIKWIGRQSFAATFVRNNRDRVPVRIAAGALADGLPKRDLFVSPGHSMLIDNALVLAKFLVNGITVTQDEPPDEIHYYQLEFETHDCVLAEGVWSESYADGPGLRGQFHNLAEFSALCPDYQAPDEIRLCAPRPVHGAVLERAILKAVTRAAHGRAVGFLRGYIDVITPAGKIEGWAQDTSQPELPVLLEILSAGVVIGMALACHHRQDLLQAGIGNGNCHFVFNGPPVMPDQIIVRRAIDGTEIAKSDDCASLKNLHKIQPDIQYFGAMRQPAGRN